MLPGVKSRYLFVSVRKLPRNALPSLFFLLALILTAPYAYSHPITADTTAPTVSITAPTAGGTVATGDIVVSATATDNIGVAGVWFRVDGAYIGTEDLTAPYSIVWNTVGVANGPHTLTAVARDAAGNQTISAPITVTKVTLDGVGPDCSGHTTIGAAYAEPVPEKPEALTRLAVDLPQCGG